MNFFVTLLTTASASLCLTSMAKYALKSEEIHTLSNHVTITHGKATVSLHLNEGNLYAESGTNVLLFIIRKDNDVVYPPMKHSDSFLALGDVPLAPVPEDTKIQLEAEDMIIIAIPPDPSKAKIEGVEKKNFLGAFMYHGSIESADDMKKQLEPLVLHNHPLRKYHLLAINVSASDECIRPSEIKEVIPLGISHDIAQLPILPYFLGIYTAVMVSLSMFAQSSFILGIDTGPSFMSWLFTGNILLMLMFIFVGLSANPDGH